MEEKWLGLVVFNVMILDYESKIAALEQALGELKAEIATADGGLAPHLFERLLQTLSHAVVLGEKLEELKRARQGL